MWAWLSPPWSLALLCCPTHATSPLPVGWSCPDSSQGLLPDLQPPKCGVHGHSNDLCWRATCGGLSCPLALYPPSGCGWRLPTCCYLPQGTVTGQMCRFEVCLHSNGFRGCSLSQHHCQSRTSLRAAALLDQELVMLEGSEPALERWPCSCSYRAPPLCVLCSAGPCNGDAPGEKHPGEQQNSCFGWDQAALEAFERQSCKEQEPGGVSEGLSRDQAEANAPPYCH